MKARYLLVLALGVVPLWVFAQGSAPFARKAAPHAILSDSSPDADQRIQTWCTDLRKALVRLKWDLEPCEGVYWKEGGRSVEGRSLVYAEFGDPTADNTTLIFSAVHGDEITPLYLGLQLARSLGSMAATTKTHVIIAPLVNPDGFFRVPRTRMNARGVDANRNFATSDWDVRALKLWRTRFRSDPRRYPGPKPESEPETTFQVELIRKVKPQKILSIHAPLNFLDYDGPTVLALAKFPRQYVHECLKLRARVKAISSGFFPGSLGNFAGQEMGIPTLTLELPTANPRKAGGYWKQFSAGIKTVIEFVVPRYAADTSSRLGTFKKMSGG